MVVEVSLKHISLRADVCFDAATEGETGGALGCSPPATIARSHGVSSSLMERGEGFIGKQPHE